jgi:hypothetical protein
VCWPVRNHFLDPRLRNVMTSSNTQTVAPTVARLIHHSIHGHHEWVCATQWRSLPAAGRYAACFNDVEEHEDD